MLPLESSEAMYTWYTGGGSEDAVGDVMDEGESRAGADAAGARPDDVRFQVHTAMLSVLRYMSGDLSLTEAAARAELPRSVITELSSELTGFMIPRTVRSMRYVKALVSARGVDSTR